MFISCWGRICCNYEFFVVFGVVLSVGEIFRRRIMVGREDKVYVVVDF